MFQDTFFPTGEVALLTCSLHTLRSKASKNMLKFCFTWICYQTFPDLSQKILTRHPVAQLDASLNVKDFLIGTPKIGSKTQIKGKKSSIFWFRQPVTFSQSDVIIWVFQQWDFSSTSVPVCYLLSLSLPQWRNNCRLWKGLRLTPVESVRRMGQWGLSL